ncbi:hypothetical protein QBC37DRAFT_409849, partial [Rhypophila decipiens]
MENCRSLVSLLISLTRFSAFVFTVDLLTCFVWQSEMGFLVFSLPSLEALIYRLFFALECECSQLVRLESD